MRRELTPAEISGARIEARRDFYFFSRWMFMQRKGFKWIRAPHHSAICAALMRVFLGQTKRLIINVPPRYSKTELAVVNWMAWCIGLVPDAEFIHTSYSGRLAATNAWQCREMVQSSAYRALFPGVELREDSHAKDEWRTTAGGCVYAVGAGGTITGYGAGKHRPGFGGAIIIDDPHKADEARSDVMRQNVIDWFQNTLESRKNSRDTPIILIMQRLHERDLAGWLLGGGNGEEWEHVCLSALKDDGTALWPEKHTADELRMMQEAAPYTFAGQYQQRPAPPDGGMFKPDKIEVVDALPAVSVEWIRGWDFAASVDGDYTVGAKLGKLPDGRFIIGDIVRDRLGVDDRDAALLNTAKRDGTAVRISIPQDPGQAGKTQALYMTRSLAGFSVEATLESGDKITRAEPFAAQVNVGNVLMLRAPWNDALVSELRLFPNGNNDDQVDALARSFNAGINATTGLLEYMRQQAEAMKAQQKG